MLEEARILGGTKKTADFYTLPRQSRYIGAPRGIVASISSSLPWTVAPRFHHCR
jgi:hypothetical protein